MKVIFNSGNLVDLSAIQSIRVSEANDKVKIHVRHKTKSGEKLSSINFRRKIRYNPDLEITKAFAEEIAKDIEDLMKNPDMSIEQVIKLEVWASGYLQMNLNTATDAQATIALTQLCWGWTFGKNNAPFDNQLKQRTGLDIGTINRIAARGDYKKRIKDLMIEARTREEFEMWVKEYGDMPARFGKRMRLCEKDVETLVESAASYHRIVLLGFSR